MNANNKNATPVVEAVGRIQIEGNVTPAAWFKTIRTEADKPDLLAISILAEIVYWYRPTVVRDEASGEITNINKKFKGHKLQKSYNHLAEQFGVSKSQAMRAVTRLVNLGVLTKEVKDTVVLDNGTVLGNVMYLEVVPEKLQEITHPIYTSDNSYIHHAQNGASDTTPIYTGDNSYIHQRQQLLSPVDIAIITSDNTLTENTTNSTTGNTTNSYSINNNGSGPKKFEDDSSDHSNGHNATQTIKSSIVSNDTQASSNNRTNPIHATPNNNSDHIGSLTFEEFWQLYPARINDNGLKDKGIQSEARAAFKAIDPADHGDLRKAVSNYQYKDARYRKNASNFLKGEWRDFIHVEIAEPKPKKAENSKSSNGSGGRKGLQERQGEAISGFLNRLNDEGDEDENPFSTALLPAANQIEELELKWLN